jgi:Peptidase M50B-like
MQQSRSLTAIVIKVQPHTCRKRRCANGEQSPKEKYGLPPMTMPNDVFLTMLMGVPAMLLHELGHIIAALLCGVKVKKVGLSRTGLYTVREAGPRWANLCVSAAGPLLNLVLALAFRDLFPGFAWVNLIACCYNLLPIPNSDGRRILALLAGSNTLAETSDGRLRSTPV